MRLTLEEVVSATSGEVVAGPPETAFDSFHTDSRQATSGLFFALRGAETDGHLFVADALARGAKGVVVDRPVETAAGAVIRVGDTWRALYELAGLVLSRVSPLVAAVTGSNGKTSTKEMLAAVLATRHRVHKTEGNLNTETGVPLTLLRLQPQHTALVLEMGMQGPGEIARLAELAKPQIGVITSVGSVHMEFFSSREDLARAKAELVRALPAGGRAILPAEDAHLPLLRRLASAPVTTFGLEAGDVRGDSYQPDGDGARFTVEGVDVRLAMPGRHQARNALAALAAGQAAGIPLGEAAAAIAGVTLDQRLRPLEAPGGYRLVDDSYNASPESMLAAFAAVAEMDRGGRLLAVLGEMRELGGLAEGEHRRVGAEAGRVFDALVVVDAGHGRLMASSAGAEVVPDPTAAAAWVRQTARPGDLVLVKASRGVHLETVVKELMGG